MVGAWAGQPSQSSTRPYYRARPVTSHPINRTLPTWPGRQRRRRVRRVRSKDQRVIARQPWRRQDDMELNERADIDTSQVNDRRGSGGGIGGLPIGGGGLA